MRRRSALVACATVGWAAAMPSHGQRRAGVPRVALILTASAEATRPFREQFVAGMRDAGQITGETYELQVLLGDGDPARSEAHLRRAVAERAAVIVVGGLLLARQARDATSTIPVVVATGSDLHEAGIVRSLARPGGNITGISDLTDEAAVKRLELTRAALPNARTVALLTNPDFPATPKIESRVTAAAQALGLTVLRLQARDRPSMVRAVDSLRDGRADVLLVGGDALMTANRAEVIKRALAARVPVVYYWPRTAEQGALFSLQPDVEDNFRRAAGYVDRILRGTPPGELPIQQPTRYELVVNAKVARSLGIVLPGSFLLRADRVIE
jgi:putative ABC transport system substrate-binding protein